VIRELEFKVLCQRHSDEIYRFARSLLANEADAEDATQEVLLRLWNHLPKMYPFNLRAWLLKTTRWYCLDQIRRRTNQAAPVYTDDEILHAQPDELAVDPSHAADSTFRLEQARALLLKLPETLRSVFVLYEVNGLRYREIADVLGIPINSVKVYLSRARERLSTLVTRNSYATEAPTNSRRTAQRNLPPADSRWNPRANRGQGIFAATIAFCHAHGNCRSGFGRLSFGVAMAGAPKRAQRGAAGATDSRAHAGRAPGRKYFGFGRQRFAPRRRSLRKNYFRPNRSAVARQF
jgi:RNA polymerase sigma-70 factor (ECF subfamily)